MKVGYKILFIIGILILMAIHWFLFPVKEGFFDDTDEYNTLRNRLQNDMDPYCKIANFVRNQIEVMQKSLADVIPSLPNSDDIQKASTTKNAQTTQRLLNAIPAESWYDYSSINIDSMYSEVYLCKDELASSRKTCNIPFGRPNTTGMRFVPCSVYMSLPESSNPGAVLDALNKITDDLPERLEREVDWFAAVIQKLNSGLDSIQDPQSAQCKIEGFEGKCSPEATAYLRQKTIEQEAANCSPLTFASEIARINRLLDNSSVQASLARCREMMAQMLKLQSDLEKAKNGNLYDWQKNGPAKSYSKFKGGDRIQSLIFSLKQNQ